MIKRTLAGVVLLVTLLVPGMASAEAPSPETLAIARELIATSRAAESVKLILPSIVQLIKPAIVQGRPQAVETLHGEVPGGGDGCKPISLHADDGRPRFAVMLPGAAGP